MLHLITQPDHAALARRIMEQWTSLQHAERSDEILVALEQHDGGWQEPDDAPTVDPETSTVLDFVRVPAAVRQEVWPRGWAGSRTRRGPQPCRASRDHGVRPYRTDDAWRAFFPVMERLRTRIFEVAGLPLKALVRDYVYVRLGDLLSLAFCTAAPAHSAGPWTMTLEGARLLVRPSPFAADVPFAITAHEIPDVPYPSDVALRAALDRAPARVLHGVVVSTPVH